MVARDQLDSSMKDVANVKSLGVPVLGVIPRMQDPVQEVRKRKRSLRLLTASALYLLVMLCFPAMELLGVPYVDQVLDRLHAADFTQNAKDLLR